MLLFGIGMHDVEQAEIRTVQAEALRLAHLIDLENDRIIAGAEATLAIIAAAPESASSDLTACSTYLNNVASKTPLFLNVIRLSADGLLECSGLPFESGTSYADEAYVQRAMATGRASVSQFRNGRISRRPQITLALPVFSPDGSLRFILSAAIEIDWLSRTLGGVGLPDDMVLIAADSTGTIFARYPDPQSWLGQTLPQLQALRSPAEGLTEGALPDDEPRIWASLAFGPSEMASHLFIGRSKTVVHAAVDGLTWKAATGAGLAGVLAILLARVGGERLLVRPAGDLVRYARGLADGLWDSKALVRPGALKEFDDIAGALSAMSGRLAKREKELQEREQRYRAIFDSTFQFTGLLTPDGLLLEANQTALDFGGLRAEEVIGRPFWETKWWQVSPETVTRLRQAIREASGGKFVRYEVEVLGKSGRTIIDFSLKPVFDPTGAVVLIVPEGRDIADRVATEAKLRLSLMRAEELTEQIKEARDRAEAAEQAKSLFLTAASHDLRQPVQALVLFQELLAARVPQDSEEGEILTFMGEATGALSDLLTGLLEIGRLEAGQIEPGRDAMPLAPLMIRLHHEYGPRALTKGLSLKTVPCGLSVDSDPVLLERIVRNLLENALRYTERGGFLLGCRRTGAGRVRLEVVDTGIGIPAQRQEEIFREFIQIDAAAAGNRGLGLGLSIMKRMAALLGCQTGLKSVPGRGSCFWIDLPLSAPIGADQPPPPVQARMLSGTCILLVDDDPLILAAFSAVLRDQGADVLTADSLADALDSTWPRAADIDLIISDFRLRGGERGTDVISKIRHRCRRHIPAAILTGDTDQAFLESAKLLGLAILHKPLKADVLIDRVAVLVGQDVNRRPNGAIDRRPKVALNQS